MTMQPRVVQRPDAAYAGTMSHNGVGLAYHGGHWSAPVSGAYTAAARIFYTPFHVAKPYSLARWWWLNGATVGTDYIQNGIYDESFNLVAASPRTLSAGTVNTPQHTTPGGNARNMLSSSSSTDATTYTTASVTLKAGRLYLMSVENSKGTTADAVSGITASGGGGPTWVSRSTTTFNASTVNRVSIWSAVPTTDITDTFVIAFGGNTQTGACWSLDQPLHVDTTTNDGIVQNAVGTGNSTTPLATLAAFASANNATFGAFGQGAAANGSPESASYLELADVTAATPAQSLQTVYRPDNDTTVTETITSAQWGACAVELKSLGTGAIVIPPMRGWLAIWGSGTTATIYRMGGNAVQEQFVYLQSGATTGLPQLGVPATSTGILYVHGFTTQATP